MTTFATRFRTSLLLVGLITCAAAPAAAAPNITCVFSGTDFTGYFVYDQAFTTADPGVFSFGGATCQICYQSPKTVPKVCGKTAFVILTGENSSTSQFHVQAICQGNVINIIIPMNTANYQNQLPNCNGLPGSAPMGSTFQIGNGPQKTITSFTCIQPMFSPLPEVYPSRQGTPVLASPQSPPAPPSPQAATYLPTPQAWLIPTPSYRVATGSTVYVSSPRPMPLATGPITRRIRGDRFR